MAEWRLIRTDGRIRACISGELDIADYDGLTKALREVEAGAVAPIVVDLSELTFIDSTGLRILIEAHNRAEADGRRFEVALATSPQVERVFELCRLGEVLRIVRPRSHDDEDSEALEASGDALASSAERP